MRIEGATASAIGFPVRLQLTDAAFARTLARDGGADLVALSHDGKQLPLEITAWNPDDVRLYVQVPARAGERSVPPRFALYFGGLARAQPNAAFWPNDTVLMLPLSGSLHDVAKGTAVSRIGYIVQNGWTHGLIMEKSHPWVSFNAQHRGFLEIDLPALDSFMVSARVRPAADSKGVLLSCGAFDLEVTPSGARFAGTEDWLTFEGEAETWHAVVCVIDRRAGTRTLCLDGKKHATDGMPAGAVTGKLRIGRSLGDAPGSQFGGDVEEVMLVSRAASTAEMTARALNLTGANSFVHLGPLEESPGRAAPPPSPELLLPDERARSHKPEGIALTWRAAVGATSYRVTLAGDPAGKSGLRHFQAGAETTFLLTRDDADADDVYWSVIAQSQQGASSPEEFRKLTFVNGSSVVSATDTIPATAPATRIRPRIALGGYLGMRIDRLARFLNGFPEANPGILRMLRQRPEPAIPSWAGVFPGQYLSSGALMAALTPELDREQLDRYVRGLIAAQRDDGYLSPFTHIQEGLELWNHYAILCGLLDYHELSGEGSSLAAARRVGDLVASAYGPFSGMPLPKNGGANEAIVHGIARLYGVTKDPRYLEFTKYVIHEAWDEPGGVRYLRLGQSRANVDAFPVRRWESVHNIMALASLHDATGDETYADAFVHLWNTLRATERHTTGGFSTNEGLLGTTHQRGTIETCCTVAWTLLTAEMLRLSGDPAAADELEWSTFNSALGSIGIDGESATYATQPDGLRQFRLLRQGPPDGIHLNCCSTNGARALGNIINWAVTPMAGGIALNLYAPGTIETVLASARTVRLQLRTRYPLDGDIRIEMELSAPEKFALALRVPTWATNPGLRVNGKPVDAFHGYTRIEREWRDGDIVELKLNPRLRTETGEGDNAGKVALFWGPILLAEEYESEPLTTRIAPSAIRVISVNPSPTHESWLVAEIESNGTIRTLVDFASAGLTGKKYRSWLPQ